MRHTKTRPTSFAELRAFLQRLGFVERTTAQAHAFTHPEAGRLLFRPYRDEETVDAHELVFARRFLDLRGVIEADDFDAAFVRADTPA